MPLGGPGSGTGAGPLTGGGPLGGPSPLAGPDLGRRDEPADRGEFLRRDETARPDEPEARSPLAPRAPAVAPDRGDAPGDDGLFDLEEDAGVEPSPEPLPASVLADQVDTAPDAGPAPDDEAGAPEGEGGEPVVIGTYASGSNNYVMFSDGSIEADTPAGVFRFASLEELKEFIASGGENLQPGA
jgi:hypothetical protein